MKIGIQYFRHGRICLWHENFLDSRFRGNDRKRDCAVGKAARDLIQKIKKRKEEMEVKNERLKNEQGFKWFEINSKEKL